MWPAPQGCPIQRYPPTPHGYNPYGRSPSGSCIQAYMHICIFAWICEYINLFYISIHAREHFSMKAYLHAMKRYLWSPSATPLRCGPPPSPARLTPGSGAPSPPHGIRSLRCVSVQYCNISKTSLLSLEDHSGLELVSGWRSIQCMYHPCFNSA
jgi:hypothetical protein